jgi:hypothetical protein
MLRESNSGKSKGLSISQISRPTGVNKGTVKRSGPQDEMDPSPIMDFVI